MNFSRVEIIVPRTRFLRWHLRLRDRLARLYPDTEVALRFDARDDAWPSGVAPLLALERMLLRRSQPTLSDLLDSSEAPEANRAGRCDLVIDLANAAPTGSDARTLRPLYDGGADDRHAVAALLAGRAPALAIEDVTTGATVASGLPSLEAADGLTGGLEAVYSRVIALLEHALCAPAQKLETPAPAPAGPSKSPAAFALRNIAFQCARAIYHLCCHSPHWRVGWRFVDGPGVMETGSLGAEPWRPMDDRNLNFAGDPFPIEWRGRTGVFYELLDYRTNKGVICFRAFDASGPVGEPVLALEEPWHLSYPHLIQHDGELYMLPEASLSGAITLYRCVEFPHRWERVAKLLEGVEAGDATIFHHGDRYWMTSVTREGVGGYSDTLAIHHAGNLFGPWEEHALRPALVDARFARPAGAVIRSGGVLLRPVQDCSDGYGRRIVVMRIDALDASSFRQSPVATIGPGAVWPGKRLHTINRCGRLECIDGAIFSPKHESLRRLASNIVWSRTVPAAAG